VAAYTSGDWHAKLGHEAEFVASWKELADWSGTEFDTAGWAKLLRDKADPQHFVSVALWPDDDMIAKWQASAEFKQRVDKIRELVDRSDIRSYEVAVEMTGRDAQ
jgi:heme-degrading monooxygenase HmoA